MRSFSELSTDRLDEVLHGGLALGTKIRVGRDLLELVVVDCQIDRAPRIVGREELFRDRIVPPEVSLAPLHPLRQVANNGRLLTRTRRLPLPWLRCHPPAQVSEPRRRV